MNPRPERCRESWLLSLELDRQFQQVQELCLSEDDYPPFRETLTKIRHHFKACENCRAWVDDWEKHGK